MKFAWLLACLSATVLAAPEKRDAGPTTTDSVNWSALGQALYVLAVLVFMRIGVLTMAENRSRLRCLRGLPT